MNDLNELFKELEDLLDTKEEQIDVVRATDITNKINKSLEVHFIRGMETLNDSITEIRDILDSKEDVDIESVRGLVEELINEVKDKVEVQKVEVTNPVEQVREVSITNVKDFPKPLDEIEVKQPKWIKELKNDDVKEVIKYLKWFRSKGLEAKIENGDPKRPVSVRLSDGKKFYTAAFQAALSGGGNKIINLDVDDALSITERVTNTNGTSTAFSTFGATTGKRNFVTNVTMFNSSGSTGYVDLRDGTTGSVIWTFPLPAGGGATHSFAHPLRQPSVSTALAYDVSAALSTVYISISGYKG